MSESILPVSAATPTWDTRYRERPAPTAPSRILVDFAGFLPAAGRAIDLACGAGRNSVFLSKQGLHTIGVDRSIVALEQGREFASKNGVRVEWIQADLERFTLPASMFDVVSCTWYRDPKLYPGIRAGLRPGGLLIYQTFTREQLRFGAGPANPEHLLAPAELLRAFEDWRILFYRETTTGRGIASLVARKPTG